MLVDGKSAYAAGAELLIQVLLQSVHFLYRVESSTEVASGKIWLGSYEVASSPASKSGRATCSTIPGRKRRWSSSMPS